MFLHMPTPLNATSDNDARRALRSVWECDAACADSRRYRAIRRSFLTQTLYRGSITTIGSGNSHTATGARPVRGSAPTSIAQ
jgi:hypothetical protein